MESWLQVKHLSHPQPVPSASRSWSDSAETSRGGQARRRLQPEKTGARSQKAGPNYEGWMIPEARIWKNLMWMCLGDGWSGKWSALFFRREKNDKEISKLGCPNIVASGHLWLCKFEFIKVKWNLEFQLLSHTSHISSVPQLRETSVYLSGWSRSGTSHHHRKFCWTELL